MHKLCRLKGDEIKALVPVVQSQEYAEYAKSHSQEDVETYLLEELGLYRHRQEIEDLRYLANKEALEQIASEQRTETVEKSSSSLRDKIGKWLHLIEKMTKINQKKKENSMENIEYSNSLYQINEILKYMEPNLKARIPKKFISYFENNKSQEYNWNIDKSLPLEKQDLLPTTKEILAVLYKDFICDDVERVKLEKTLSNNEIKYQEELRKKYNPDNIFKDRQKSTEYVETQKENTEIATYKESFFSKIISKIKLIFHK